MTNEKLMILYEDPQLVVCVKPVGVLSEDADTGKCMPALLRSYFRESGKPDYIAGVHRLDKNVGGLMVFSRKKEITGKLIDAIAQHEVQKEYLAVLRGHPAEREAELTDLLFHDSTKNKTYVVRRERKGVREARLSYTTVGEHENLTMVRVRLHTGRTHQIRAQFSSRGLPLLGDIRYGSKDPDCDCALWSCSLSFIHPTIKKTMCFYQPPENAYPWNLFELPKE